MTRVYFVRHGQHGLVDKTLAGRMAGVHLSAEGERQAAALARHFTTIELAAVLSSPLERCRETAAPVATARGLAVETDAGLTEIDCGEWTGKSFEDLQGDPRWFAWNHERGRSRTPGGESTAELQARIMGVLEARVATEAAPAILVTHSDVIKVAVATLLGAPLDWHDRLVVDPASITTLDLWPGGGKVVRLNEAVA